ncbi:MAG TPA: hypothetical protein VK898_12125, partial [Chloroflexota bacterium]|nr:hypothetical protein [Chloroflexota bacterium]
WTLPRTRWLVIAVQAAFILPASVNAGLQLNQDLPWPPVWAGTAITLPLGFGLLALQLRLSLAFAAGERLRFAAVSAVEKMGQLSG